MDTGTSRAVAESIHNWLATREGKRVSRNLAARELRRVIDRRKFPLCQKWLRGNCLQMYGGSCEKARRGCPYVVFGDDATSQQVAAWFLVGLYPGLSSSTARRMRLRYGGIR